jgi:hypothetical protein
MPCYLLRSTIKNGSRGTCRRQKDWAAILLDDDSLILGIVSLVSHYLLLMRRRPNPDSEANIRRIDTKARAKKQTHGFQVHFLRGSNVVTKMFSDSIYGGKEGARRAARRFRRTAMRRLPERKSVGFN